MTELLCSYMIPSENFSHGFTNLNNTLKTNFSKTPQQKLKVKLYSNRVGLSLSEYNFTFNF